MKVYYTTEEGGIYKRLKNAKFVVITDDNDKIISNYDGVINKSRNINGEYFTIGILGFLRETLKVKIHAFYCNNGVGWFRLFGYGLQWKDTTTHALLFSQRIGRSKSLQLGKWNIRILKPNKH